MSWYMQGQAVWVLAERKGCDTETQMETLDVMGIQTRPERSHIRDKDHVLEQGSENYAIQPISDLWTGFV